MLNKHILCIIKCSTEEKIKMNKDKVVIENLKLLPDKYDDFRAKFIAPDNSLINMDVFYLKFCTNLRNKYQNILIFYKQKIFFFL